MKSHKKAKAKTRSRSKAHIKTRTRTRPKTKMPSPALAEPVHGLNVSTTPPLKTCQEVEVGDIGGFGSPEELEEHEKRCSEPATSFCTNCGKNLCQNHYNLLHRDHEHTSGQTTNTSLA